MIISTRSQIRERPERPIVGMKKRSLGSSPAQPLFLAFPAKTSSRVVYLIYTHTAKRKEISPKRAYRGNEGDDQSLPIDGQGWVSCLSICGDLRDEHLSAPGKTTREIEMIPDSTSRFTRGRLMPI